LRDHRHGKAAPRSPRPDARQRPMHPPRRTRLPDGIRLRDLRLLPHRHTIPAHPHPPARPRPRPRPSRPGRTIRRAHPARRNRAELTPMPQTRLAPGDAPELAETLPFLTNWLSGSHKQALAQSFAAFAGHPAYNTDTLCADLRRFVFLLGASDGEELFGEPTP